MTAPWSRVKILGEVSDERQKQIEKWGLQQHPQNNSVEWKVTAERTLTLVRTMNDHMAENAPGLLTWDDILREEYYEAAVEEDLALKRAELVQVAAVAVAMIEAIDAGGEPV